jgi:uncharacterized protein YdeI (YjbR/CyaY-like superfamily)
MRLRFFESPAEFREWLEANHGRAEELWVGFHKKATGKPSLSWPQSVREALAFGWIDGIRKSVDEESYTIRFSPRRPSSVWSAINLRMAQELIAEKRMHPAGLKAFGARKENRSGIYSYENRPATLPPEYEKRLKKNREVWKAFESQTPSRRRTLIWWVVSAKKEETRLARLGALGEHIAVRPESRKK